MTEIYHIFTGSVLFFFSKIQGYVIKKNKNKNLAKICNLIIKIVVYKFFTIKLGRTVIL